MADGKNISECLLHLEIAFLYIQFLKNSIVRFGSAALSDDCQLSGIGIQ